MAMNHRLLRPRQAGSLPSTPFDPTTIAGLEAWWDAADASTVTLDGGRVAAWADKSGNGRELENTVSGSTQPDYVSNALNAKAVVRFDRASGQLLLLTAGATGLEFIGEGSNAYVAIVALLESTASAYHWILTQSPAFSLDCDNQQISFPAFWRQGCAAFSVRNSSNQSVVNLLSPDFFFQTTANVVELLVDADNATAGERAYVRKNGGTLVGGNTSSNAASATTSPTLSLGGRTNASPATAGFDGDVAEVLVYSQHPSESEQSAVRAYLAAKWGVTLA